MAQKLSRGTLDWVEAKYREANVSFDAQARWNHEDCPAGMDKRQRLYTRLTDDGRKILLHCFNCGGSGFINYKAPSRPLTTLLPETINRSDQIQWQAGQDIYNRSFRLRYDDESDPKSEWPYKYFKGLGDQMDDKDWYGIRVTSDGWFLIPRGTQGFDVRKPDKKFSRWTDPRKKHESKVLVYNSTNSDVAVLCEDALSAMKIDLTGYAGVALCGSSLGKDDAFKLAMRFKTLIVWLDNDNKEVIANAKQAEARLKLYSDRVARECACSDPKGFSTAFIEGIVSSQIVGIDE